MAEASRVLKVVGGRGEGQPAAGKSVNRAHLVNRLNFLNFQDQTILVNLRHVSYDNSIFLRARPLPCAGERLDCAWAENAGLTQLLKTYRFDFLLIPDGKKYLLVTSELVNMDDQGLSLVLPAVCREFGVRRIKRHLATDVVAEIAQNGALFEGELVDFTPVSLKVVGNTSHPASHEWFNFDGDFNLRLARRGVILYSGAFGIVTESSNGKEDLVLQQLENSIQRFRKKKYRNARQQLVPSPSIVFDHPLIDKRINLKVSDISATGFSVEESEGESVLMTGMIVPELRIAFAQGFSITCAAQIVSRNVIEGPGERTVRCGAVILDMDVHEHVKLLSILHQVANQRSYVCTEIDMNDLWDFFFETGFIYPGKYAHFQANKEEIKRTYAKLYGDNPQIARHFIYLDRGAILGHLAMVRFYRDSWMIHHHAARKSVTIRAGLAVLDQVGQYANELEHFSFAHLHYVYCFYRPDNKFPSRVFGGFARQNEDPRVCSEDTFAYGYCRAAGEDRALPESWELVPSSRFDFAELGNFYRFVSGGLLIEAFDLEPGRGEQHELDEEYRALGFKKEKFHYSLRKDGALKAFILINITDAGFNMAELTNCATIFVLDEELARELVDIALAKAARHYEGAEMPVLSYPVSWLDRHAVPYDKTYTLWILNMRHSDNYFEYCDGLFKSMKKAPASIERG